MSSAVVMERFALGSPHQAGHSQQWHPGQLPAGSPAAASWCVVLPKSDRLAWNGNNGSTSGELSAGGPVPVPEPSTLVLAALGLAGISTVARRRYASQAMTN
jgi:PEP-CTERM motif